MASCPEQGRPAASSGPRPRPSPPPVTVGTAHCRPWRSLLGGRAIQERHHTLHSDVVGVPVAAQRVLSQAPILAVVLLHHVQQLQGLVVVLVGDSVGRHGATWAQPLDGGCGAVQGHGGGRPREGSTVEERVQACSAPARDRGLQRSPRARACPPPPGAPRLTSPQRCTPGPTAAPARPPGGCWSWWGRVGVASCRSCCWLGGEKGWVARPTPPSTHGVTIFWIHGTRSAPSPPSSRPGAQGIFSPTGRGRRGRCRR